MAFTFYAQGKEIPRDRYNRPLIVPPDGGEPRAYQRVTTLAKMLEDTTGLHKWELRRVVYGLSQRPDLIALASSLGEPDSNNRRDLQDVAYKALDVTDGNKSGLGTAFHGYAENVDRGKPLGFVPEDMKPMLSAYEALMHKEDLQVSSVEEFVVYDPFEVGGTPDKIILHEGKYKIGDIKTGSLDYPMSWALQLGIYSRSKRYDLSSAQRFPLVEDGEIDLNEGLIIHVPVHGSTATLIPIDLDKGWQMAQAAYAVAQARQMGKHVLGDPIGEERALSVDELIEAADSIQDLTDIWEIHQREWSPFHTAKATERRLILEGK